MLLGCQIIPRILRQAVFLAGITDLVVVIELVLEFVVRRLVRMKPLFCGLTMHWVQGQLQLMFILARVVARYRVFSI